MEEAFESIKMDVREQDDALFETLPNISAKQFFGEFLRRAIKQNSYNTISDLMRHSFAPAVVEAAKDINGSTSIIQAMKHKTNLDILKRLLPNDNVNAVNSDGDTALSGGKWGKWGKWVMCGCYLNMVQPWYRGYPTKSTHTVINGTLGPCS